MLSRICWHRLDFPVESQISVDSISWFTLDIRQRLSSSAWLIFSLVILCVIQYVCVCGWVIFNPNKQLRPQPTYMEHARMMPISRWSDFTCKETRDENLGHQRQCFHKHWMKKKNQKNETLLKSQQHHSIIIGPEYRWISILQIQIKF